MARQESSGGFSGLRAPIFSAALAFIYRRLEERGNYEWLVEMQAHAGNDAHQIRKMQELGIEERGIVKL